MSASTSKLSQNSAEHVWQQNLKESNKNMLLIINYLLIPTYGRVSYVETYQTTLVRFFELCGHQKVYSSTPKTKALPPGPIFWCTPVHFFVRKKDRFGDLEILSLILFPSFYSFSHNNSTDLDVRSKEAKQHS